MGTINKNAKWVLPYLSIYFFVAIIVIILVVRYLSNQYETIKKQSFQELKNISSTKVENLKNFIKEEEYKLQQLINSEFFKSQMLSFLSNERTTTKFYNFLNDVKFIKNLEDILIINRDGKIIFNFKILPYNFDSITVKFLQDKDTVNVLIDIFRDIPSGIVYAYQFPLFGQQKDAQKIIGFIRFQYDAKNTLLPRIEHFEPFSTREVLLIKKSDNQITYLSYLRRVPIKPLNLTENISEYHCWQKLNEIDSECFYDGLDYSGVPVLASLEMIPGTNWILMTKQNKSEIFSNFDSYRKVMIFTTALLLSVLGIALAFTIHIVKEKQERKNREIIKQKEKIEQELVLISEQISDVVFILNLQGVIVRVNKSAEKLYGYKVDELIGKTIDTVCLVNEMNELFERFKIIQEKENYIYETIHKRKDGTLIEVEVNARTFTINGERFLIGSVRDISERKQILRDLERKLEIEKFLTEIASDLINITYETQQTEITKILGRIGEFTKFDRVRIFMKDKFSEFFNCEFEWCRFGVDPQKERLQFLDIKNEFPYLYSIIQKGQTFKCSNIEQLPLEAKNEKAELNRQKIKSFMWKPLIFKGKLIGFMSLTNTNPIIDWKGEIDTLINICCEIILNALQRMQFEKELADNEKKFKKLVENSNDVILIVSRDFKNLYVSSTSEKVLGYSSSERYLKNPFELIHADDVEIVIKALNSLKNVGDKTTIQFRAKHKLGNYIWIEATITNLIDEPYIGGYVVNYHDITETKEAYQKLQESEERYRILTEESGDVLYKLNYETMTYEYLSPVISKLTGYSPEEINSIGFNNLVEEIYLILEPYKTVEEIKESRIKRETGEYLADYKIRTKYGEMKWVRDHSFPVLNEDGKIVGSIGILTDITELKKKEEEIVKREKYLDVLVEIQKTLIFLEDLKEFYNLMLPKLGQLTNASRCYVFENSFDENGRILMSQVAEWCNEGITPQINNPQLQNLPYDELGLDLIGEMLGKGYWSKIVNTLPEPTKTILESQEIISILLIPIMIHDEFFGFIGFDDCQSEREWSLMEIEILQSAAASIALAIESKRKKDEIIRARDEAIEANRLRSAFISLLSHEIRTPLNSIMGYNTVLKDLFFNPDNKELTFYFEAIQRNSERLLNTINHLVEISRLEAGMLKTNIEILDLNEFIIDTYQRLKIRAEEKNLNLTYSIPDKKLNIIGDKYCVSGILENLVTNAIKYSDKGTIEISANELEEHVELIVKDQGIGISEEYMKHLFQPFSQEDLSFKRKFEGTGLGLAITKRYVDLIGAEIKIESQKGVGTTCFVKFKKAEV